VNVPASVRGHCAKASIPFSISSARKDSMPTQLRLVRHELKASMSRRDAAELKPDLERACTVGQRERLRLRALLFAHMSIRNHSAELAAERTQTTKRRATSSITRRKAKKVKENVFSSDKDMTELRPGRLLLFWKSFSRP
jgi:hypothetical protein